MLTNKYPRIHIQSKAEFARHISHTGYSRNRTLKLINDVLEKKDRYWKDSQRSKPEESKYVRSAKGRPLGLLLDKINKKILAPHDRLIPSFIFGGVNKASHVKAVNHLLGDRKKRVLLKLDISRFFERVSAERVTAFFRDKCECTEKMAKMLSNICCVPVGPKGSGAQEKTIARGFATSSRLAVWCNLNLFTQLESLVQKRLKGKDPRIAIYVDDIGITASGATEKEMNDLYEDIDKLFQEGDRNQQLPLNAEKKKILTYEDIEKFEHLGLRMHRKSLSLGNKTLFKQRKLRKALKRTSSVDERERIERQIKAINNYERVVKKAHIINREAK